MGVEAPNGALIMESMRTVQWTGDARSWRGSTSEAGGAAQPHKTTAFVIGMHIEGLGSGALAGLLQSLTATSYPTIASVSTTQVSQQPSSVVLSGGLQAYADSSNSTTLIGQFATVSAPLTTTVFTCQPGGPCGAVQVVSGWRVESKDQIIAHPGTVHVQMLSLPASVTVNGTTYNVVGKLVSATSAVAAHPAIDVTGLRGEYALSGIGATVDWNTPGQSAYGNVLWRLEPRADLGGASVASKDHVISSPASITGYAIGIKLMIPVMRLPPVCCRTLN
jgi:hypothetical protein